MNSNRQTLSKSERLKSYKRIRLLFAEGQKFKVLPLLVFYQIEEKTEVDFKGDILQMGVSVGARYFKKAVDRNLLKRRIREAYRKNNQQLKETLSIRNRQMAVFFVYTQNEICDYAQIAVSMNKAIQLLEEKIIGKLDNTVDLNP